MCVCAIFQTLPNPVKNRYTGALRALRPHVFVLTLMKSYAHDVCTQKTAILMQEYLHNNVLANAFCDPK
jgi:hypothetical protein